MHSFYLLSCVGLASALVPQCHPQLGEEFCPSSQAMSNEHHARYEEHRKEYPVIFPNSTTQNKVLEETLFPELNKARVEKDLREFTDPGLFKSRHCASKFGKLAQYWIFDKIHNITARSVDVRFIRNKTPQSSVVIKIPGLSNNSISIGAHIDSINQYGSENGTIDTMIAPGADDNGSGSIVLLEVFRAFIAHVTAVGVLQNEVQFHWYASEEIGLVGSRQVFSDMRDKSFPLRATLNLDMIGYPGEGADKIGVQQDHVDKNLTAFVTSLVETVSNYVSSSFRANLAHTVIICPDLLSPSPLYRAPFMAFKSPLFTCNYYSNASAGNITCGYPCSDHASAFRYKYASAMVGESAYIKTYPFAPVSSNPFIHTASDTIENNIDFDYMMKFARLALAFVVELGDYHFE
ncbi:Leucine aminopeptidase A [Cytospora mali]|uniref:Peptide hydrolase n=1 Tax=Cytospora mali TaxID=578113 RepID=A0A194UT92_CYTMA|nr:Leucine aminopeptidase A [Valsa mali var. pyri (nom. inval.)]